MTMLRNMLVMLVARYACYVQWTLGYPDQHLNYPAWENIFIHGCRYHIEFASSDTIFQFFHPEWTSESEFFFARGQEQSLYLTVHARYGLIN